MTQEMKDARARKIECMWDYLRATAQNYGFTVKEWENGRREIWDETRTVNFTVHEDVEFDAAIRLSKITYSVSAAIAIMGGNPDAEELKMRGERIVKAGAMIRTFEIAAQYGLAMTVEFEY